MIAKKAKELMNGLAGFGMRAKNFLFLQDHGLEAAYLMLLALARSNRDVVRLHGFLSENCQLLQNNLLPDKRKLPHGDLIDLQRFWRDVVHNGNPPYGKGKRMSDEHAQSFLQRLCVRQRGEVGGDRFDSLSLHDYYVAALADFATTDGIIRVSKERDCQALGIRFEVWADFDSSNLDDKSKGTIEAKVSLFFQEFRLRCYWLPDTKNGGQLKIWLSVSAYELTTGLLYGLATLPDFAVNDNIGLQLDHATSDAGLHFLIPWPELMEHLEDGQDDWYFVAKPTFTVALKKKLQAFGIPLQGDIRPHGNVEF